MIQTIITAAFTVSCSTVMKPPNGMVDWSLANTTRNILTMSVHYKVCNRNYFRVAIPRTREKSIATCTDSDGKTDVRYRKYSFKTNPDNP